MPLMKSCLLGVWHTHDSLCALVFWKERLNSGYWMVYLLFENSWNEWVVLPCVEKVIVKALWWAGVRSRPHSTAVIELRYAHYAHQGMFVDNGQILVQTPILSRREYWLHWRAVWHFHCVFPMTCLRCQQLAVSLIKIIHQSQLWPFPLVRAKKEVVFTLAPLVPTQGHIAMDGAISSALPAVLSTRNLWIGT